MTSIPTLLEELDALAEKATPGLWEYDDPSDSACWAYCDERGCPENHPTGTFVVDGPDWDLEASFGAPPRILNEADAALIVELRNAYPTLRAEIRRLAAAAHEFEVRFNGADALLGEAIEKWDDARAEILRLRAALEAVLVRDSEWGLSGMPNDCGCPRLSKAAEREYEAGKCPHQRARAALKGSEGGE